jgi:hypothetical protein
MQDVCDNSNETFPVRWSIPDEMRPQIVKRLFEIGTGESAREAISAARVLVAMERINQIEDERMTGVIPLPKRLI